MADEASSVGFVGRGENEYAAFAMTMDQYNETKGFADDSTRTFPQKVSDAFTLSLFVQFPLRESFVTATSSDGHSS
jgi:hypothetical protein